MTRCARLTSRFVLPLLMAAAAGACSTTEPVQPVPTGGTDAARITLSATPAGEDGYREFQKVNIVASVVDGEGRSVDIDEVKWNFNNADGLVARGPRQAELTLVRGPNVVTAFYFNRAGQRLETSLAIDAQPSTQAMVVWQADGSAREISLPPGARSIIPAAINDRGEIAGSVDFGSGHRAFYWSALTGFRFIGGIGEDYSVGTDLNQEGVVVGFLRLRTEVKGFVWSVTNGLSLFGDSGSTIAEGINDSRVIAATQNYHAVRGAPDSQFKRLAMPPEGQCSVASAIGNAGHVTGWIGTRFDEDWCVNWSPVVWDPDGTVHTIYECSKEVECPVTAIDVNRWGEVVGNRGSRPFRWTKADGFRELIGDAGGSVAGINDRGEVAGMMTYGVTFPVLWRADNSIRVLALPPGKNVGTTHALNNLGDVVGVVR